MASNSLFDNGRTVPDQFPDEEVEWVELSEEGDQVEGEILDITDNAGAHGSRVYKLNSPEHENPVLFWGKTDIDRKVDRADLDLGDSLGVRNSGESREFTTDGGETRSYDLYHVVFDRQSE